MLWLIGGVIAAGIGCVTHTPSGTLDDEGAAQGNGGSYALLVLGAAGILYGVYGLMT